MSKSICFPRDTYITITIQLTWTAHGAKNHKKEGHPDARLSVQKRDNCLDKLFPEKSGGNGGGTSKFSHGKNERQYEKFGTTFKQTSFCASKYHSVRANIIQVHTSKTEHIVHNTDLVGNWGQKLLKLMPEANQLKSSPKN